MIGCSKDHAKEIDIFNKNYEQKMERIKSMKEQGNEAIKVKDYKKASYYYAQALLIFYYLIPEGKEEETASEDLRR